MMIPPAAPAIRTRPEMQYAPSPTAIPGRSSIVLATTDAQILDGMGELLRGYRVNTIWARGTEEIRAALAGNDVLGLLNPHHEDVRMVIFFSPECPQEYRDSLAALNIRAFDFICHPYRNMDLERILDSVVALRNAPIRTSTAHSPDRSFESDSLRRAS